MSRSIGRFGRGVKPVYDSAGNYDRVQTQARQNEYEQLYDNGVRVVVGLVVVGVVLWGRNSAG
jgi:hypothetical protein